MRQDLVLAAVRSAAGVRRVLVASCLRVSVSYPLHPALIRTVAYGPFRPALAVPLRALERQLIAETSLTEARSPPVGYAPIHAV